jgi:ppGpp synthetase/RelA/SpoT-type nucleotidyltranferase
MLNCSMEALEQALERFTRERPIYQRLAESTAEELRGICDGAAIHCRASGRAKDIRSYHTKVLEKAYADPWGDVSDKAGARLIFDSAADVDSARYAIHLALGSRVLAIEDKRSFSSPERLGYSGVHMQVMAMDNGNAYECEVQLRTGAQDLWSTMSHRYLYKPVIELPSAVQHAAYRLVAIVELFDEELQRIADQATAPHDDAPSALQPILSDHYLQIAHAPSNRRVGQEILAAISSTFTSDEIANYEAIIEGFIDAEGQGLVHLYEEYGPHSAVAYLPSYLLFSQAESLALLERLSVRRHLVANAWRQSDLPWTYLETLATAAGLALPVDDR